MSTHGINAMGVLIGNPDEIVFVLTKGDVERVYNMENNLNLGTPLPESVWSAFKNNMYRLDDRLDHAAALEDILNDYCRVPVMIAPPPPVAPAPVAPAPVAPAPVAPAPVAPAPVAPAALVPQDALPVPPVALPALLYASVPAVDNWDKLQRKKYDTKKFTPPGYGHHVVWSAHRVRAFMVALKLKPTVYDTNLRTLAQLAGVHPYDFRWKTNPVSFGKKRGLSEMMMRQMMGNSYYVMNQRFSANGY